MATSTAKPSGQPVMRRELTWLETKVTHKGHHNLSIRGTVNACNCICSILLIAVESDIPHKTLTAIFQLLACFTLFYQFFTANPKMFVCRGLCSYARCLIALHGAVCGRRWPGEECVTGAWEDIRRPFRVIACVAAIRFLANGTSLLLQFKYPRRGVGQHGNEQLFYRGSIQLCGVPLHFVLAMMKLGELEGTVFERNWAEPFVHFAAAFVLIPISAWSLFDQWANSGTGRKTDDIRTCFEGDRHLNAADTLFSLLEAHKGHRNLMIRSTVAFSQAVVTFCLLSYDIDRPHKGLVTFLQLCGSATLAIQWRTGNPWMFVGRGLVNWLICVLVLHAASCGRTWPWEDCVSQAWDDIRQPFRILHVLAATRNFFNGLSLFCQFHWPHWMFGGHGNLQLLLRSCVQISGVPIHLARAYCKLTILEGTLWQRSDLEVTTNFLRCPLMCVAAWSLWHQWWHTGAGNAGHPAADKHEEKRGDGHGTCAAVAYAMELAVKKKKKKASAAEKTKSEDTAADAGQESETAPTTVAPAANEERPQEDAAAPTTVGNPQEDEASPTTVTPAAGDEWPQADNDVEAPKAEQVAGGTRSHIFSL